MAKLIYFSRLRTSSRSYSGKYITHFCLQRFHIRACTICMRHLGKSRCKVNFWSNQERKRTKTKNDSKRTMQDSLKLLPYLDAELLCNIFDQMNKCMVIMQTDFPNYAQVDNQKRCVFLTKTNTYLVILQSLSQKLQFYQNVTSRNMALITLKVKY